jgi:hypothetical protein
MRTAFKNSATNEEKNPLQRFRHKWQDDMKNENKNVDGINLAWDRIRCCDLVNAVTNVVVPYMRKMS